MKTSSSNRKTKKTLIAAVLIILLCVAWLVGTCLFLRENIFGYQEYIEGDNIEIITNRFTSFSEISQCYYQIIYWHNGFFAPDSYAIRAIVVIDQQESARLKDQYEWYVVQKDVVIEDNVYKDRYEMFFEEGPYEGIGMEAIGEWLHCKEFSSDTLGCFMGDVFFSEEGNCIYIHATRD